ncbi:unnamed protein product [Rhizophagus irregularis]|uniref:Uncharacterized protein n=1 Tax=Rhizophagus irregularis TaxID=588596 RepID=A0A2I1GFE9_9GLOM|nr:hypothetical protein RhiirA4_459879 [Rhizophagus irregularis]CAB4414196.1 unnamed protein product [Rhizophagus irregularis]
MSLCHPLESCDLKAVQTSKIVDHVVIIDVPLPPQPPPEDAEVLAQSTGGTITIIIYCYLSLLYKFFH